MSFPENRIYIVAGEVVVLLAALKRTSGWTHHYQEEQDPLTRGLMGLKEMLGRATDLSDMEPSVYFGPFLDIVRTAEMPGAVTSMALATVNKFLSYGLIDPRLESAAATAESVADAVTRVRFAGTDTGSDEVVLVKILHVLRSLFLSPVGALLSNESLCEIMQTCIRICFEGRLSGLLRKVAEQALTDMVQLLFCRFPQFSEAAKGGLVRKLKMRSGAMEGSKGSKKRKSPQVRHTKTSRDAEVAQQPHAEQAPTQNASVTSAETCSTINTDSEAHVQDSSVGDPPGVIHLSDSVTSIVDMEATAGCQGDGFDNSLQVSTESFVSVGHDGCEMSCPESHQPPAVPSSLEASTEYEEGKTAINCTGDNDYVNPRGVRFTTHHGGKEGPVLPYGLPTAREVLRFLCTLISPYDPQNTDSMISIGLSLVAVALESGGDQIGNFPSVLALVKDDLCRNLFALISTPRNVSILPLTIRACFLLFESLRTHLKFQLEMYLTKLMELVVTEPITYIHKELAVDAIVHLWRIPGLVTELYLNYDCDLFCSNVYEDLTKVLSTNPYPMADLCSVHLLCLDALLAVVDSIETHCHFRTLLESHAKTIARPEEGSASPEAPTTPPAPPLVLVPFGYQMGQQMLGRQSGDIFLQTTPKGRESLFIQPNRKNVSENIPTHEELMAIKHRKKVLASGTEHFNAKPSKGIEFLQEHGLLSNPLDPAEVAAFLRDNAQLDKKKIGEYVSNRKNLKVLDAFVKSFCFQGTRIDEALRMYLETFRLPGEAPLIALLMEHFAEHWHKSTGEPFANSDAAFTLAYAVIMLNVDQHNHNVKKQINPMTLEGFKKNLKNVNGGIDFDKDMLEQVYNAIRNEEIVMPAEQTGLVRENYLWKVLLRRGMAKGGAFVHAPNGLLDHDLFTLVWSAAVSTLSFVLDKAAPESMVLNKAIAGYRKCASIAAHYAMSDVFDHLIISLCKFTALTSTEAPESIPAALGNSQKAQLAAKTVFTMAHRHGDILRDGWKNLIDCMLRLYLARLLPEPLVTAEDFVDPSGSVSLARPEESPLQAQRNEQQGFLSSVYSYLTESSQRGPNPEDEKAREAAQACVVNCNPELLISESKFLRIDALQELVKALIYACHGPESHSSMSGGYDEYSTVFLLEVLIKVVLQNKDRVGPIWPAVRDHLYSLVMGASASDYRFLLERAVVGILRLAIRLILREEMASQVLQSLGMLLMLKPATIQQVSRQVAYALYELLRTSAPCIHAAKDWATVFSLMACAGAGLRPPGLFGTLTPASPAKMAPTSVEDDGFGSLGVQSDSELSRKTPAECCEDRGYTSDSELYQNVASSSSENTRPPSAEGMPALHSAGKSGLATGGWILVSEGDEGSRGSPTNQYSIMLACDLMPHDPFALAKCCECLAFLVRDMAHITQSNVAGCIRCIRVFVEASLHGGQNARRKGAKTRGTKMQTRRRDDHCQRKQPRSHSEGYEGDSEDRLDEAPSDYQRVSIQLLDLMHVLHTRAASIVQVKDTTPPDTTGSFFHAGLPARNAGDLSVLSGQPLSLWSTCWCPLLQGIARLCCDTRRDVRTSALTYLQRSLLAQDLQALTALEWEACFNKVLFPLLTKLMENVSPCDPLGMEETRMRGATLLCKVFLQHLNPLLSLPTFTALWMTILDFMEKYMRSEGSDLLSEAIPESLKNMLLVMETAGVFEENGEELGAKPQTGNYGRLWSETWDRIGSFLPNLHKEVFKPPPVPPPPNVTVPTTSSLSESPSATSIPSQRFNVDSTSLVPSAAPQLVSITTTTTTTHGGPSSNVACQPSGVESESNQREFASITGEDPPGAGMSHSSTSVISDSGSLPTATPVAAQEQENPAFEKKSGITVAGVTDVGHPSVILHPPSFSPPPMHSGSYVTCATVAPVPLLIDPTVFGENQSSAGQYTLQPR
uniref:Putative pattern-formation protein/guanine nucleotide exchange factor n=1 Tax=Ornithodoros turicata TaxID=34597 RepID=A0A2R5LB52_9ACAR